jgi:hypothetical protein
VQVSPERAKGLPERLAKADVRTLPIQNGNLKIWWNESILRQPPDRILAPFVSQS